MSGARLVLTRPRQQTLDWLSRLAQFGVDALSLPLIDIVPSDGSAASAAWQELPGAGMAMFVSPNAVSQFFAHRPAGRVWPAQTLAACVGPGSAKALLAEGVPADQIVQPPLGAASLDSEHLWPQLQQRGPWQGRRCLMLRGDGGREWLAERLREAGAQTLAFNVYQRRSPSLDASGQTLLAQILQRPERHVWLFSSAEAIGNLQGLAPPATDWSRASCIATHERIAARARTLGLGLVVLARPEASSVVEAFRAMQG
ncbi:uroporphyrinogen-III synthase [Roseateles sp.]|uniref:uroporphyrinogen-III synthase n=1 Tax=Roseateles sp. TaxID=1971397 RepID=UPI003BA72474